MSGDERDDLFFDGGGEDGGGAAGNDDVDEELPYGERLDEEEDSAEASAGVPEAAAVPPAMPFPMADETSADLDIGRELSQLLALESERVEASRTQEGHVETEPMLCFQLADVWFGAPTSRVRQVVGLPTIFPVPTTPAYLLGVANLNGQVTPVIDLRRFLGIEAAAPAASPFAALAGGNDGGGLSPRAKREGGEEIGTRRMVVVHAEGMTAGFPVDLVREVLDVPTGLFQPARVSEGRVREFARGELRFRQRVLTLLELPALLKAAQIQPQSSLQGAGESPR